MDILKTLGEVDFTKYALSPISQYVYSGQKLAELKMCKFVKNIFFCSTNKFFMHIYNMSVTYLQSIGRIH